MWKRSAGRDLPERDPGLGFGAGGFLARVEHARPVGKYQQMLLEKFAGRFMDQASFGIKALPRATDHDLRDV